MNIDNNASKAIIKWHDIKSVNCEGSGNQPALAMSGKPLPSIRNLEGWGPLQQLDSLTLLTVFDVSYFDLQL